MPSPFCYRALLVLCLWQVLPCQAIDSLKLDERTGLFTATDKTVPVVTARYVGWQASWKWADARVRPAPKLKADALYYSGEIKDLGINFMSSSKVGKDHVTWSYEWDNKADHPNAIGFGVDFILNKNSSSFESAPAAHELLPNNQGWRWRTPDGEVIEVKFTPALPKVAFDKSLNIVRALFFTGVAKGNYKTTMQVTVSKGVALAGMGSSRYAESASGRQPGHRDILSDKAAPIDLSFLNSNDLPAGKHGFLKAAGEKLVFEDGAPVKFWGTNMMAYALFATPDTEIKMHAKRLAQLGYNLVRITHHDSDWVKPNIFKNQKDNTQELNPETLKKLDWWIKCLAEEGIYTWLDLHVARVFTKADGITYFDETVKNKGDARGFNYYNESIQAQLQKFNEAHLNHVNPFTGLAYKADPAIVAVLITNENDLTQHFGNIMLPNKGFPQHNALFDKDFKQFAEAKRLPVSKVWLTWEMGESKIYLSDVEHRFNEKMISHLRNLGEKSLIATTNKWSGMGLFGLPSLTDGDLIDAHAYGREGELNFNPRFNPTFLARMGDGQVAGMPFSVTEWNIEPFPTADRFTSPLYTASIASLQGWDALMLYGYSQYKLSYKISSDNYTTFIDPSIQGLMPAAALLYRQDHVSLAKKTYELRLNERDFFFIRQDATTSKTLRTLAESSRITIGMPQVPALPWLAENNAKTEKNSILITDANVDYIPKGQDFVSSDTGELKRDWVAGIHTINTSKSQVASGAIGDKNITLDDVTFKITTKQAAVAVQSLENKPIKQSKKIFISLIGRSSPEKEGFIAEPITGELQVSAPAGLKLFRVNGVGYKEPVPANYSRGRYSINLNQGQGHWYILSAS